MRLKEFIDTNGNQVKISKTTSTVSKASSGGFKKKFEKLMAYATKHRYSKINKVEVTKLTEDSLEFEEHYDGGAIVNYKIYIGPATEAWHIEAFTTILNAKDREKVDDIVGTGWVELLKTLRNYMMVPVTGTPEYKDLVFEDSKEDFLKEFVDSKGNKVNLKNSSSSSSKPTTNVPDQTYRFQRLVAQIKSDGICKCEVKALTASVLALVTDKRVVIRLERIASSHPYILHIGNHADAYADYDEVLEVLIDEGIIANTDLCESLEEWVDSKGNKVVLNKTSSNSSAPASKTNKEKFEELVKYMEKYSVAYTTKMETSHLDNTVFKYNINRKTPGVKEYTITLEVDYSRFNSSWEFVVYRNGDYVDDANGKGWEELLKALRASEFGVYAIIPKPGSKEYESLTESASLQEFIDKNGNKVTFSKTSSSVSQAAPTVSSTKGGYWERFNKLLFYHVNHKSPAVDKVIRTKVSKDGFHYTEHVRAGTTGFDKDVVVNIDLAATENWKLQTYIDGKPHIGGAGYGYVNLLKELRKYLNLPVAGTPEYTKLLTESLDSSFAEDFQVYENLWD